MGNQTKGTNHEILTRGENQFLYRTWKIDKQIDGSWRCIRIQPTEWFTASSLNAAISSIDRREGARNELQTLPKGNNGDS